MKHLSNMIALFTLLVFCSPIALAQQPEHHKNPDYKCGHNLWRDTTCEGWKIYEFECAEGKLVISHSGTFLDCIQIRELEATESNLLEASHNAIKNMKPDCPDGCFRLYDSGLQWTDIEGPPKCVASFHELFCWKNFHKILE